MECEGGGLKCVCAVRCLLLEGLWSVNLCPEVEGEGEGREGGQPGHAWNSLCLQGHDDDSV